MPQQDEREYLERRLQTCEQMASNATDPGIALIHQQFAAEYSRRLARSDGTITPGRPTCPPKAAGYDIAPPISDTHEWQLSAAWLPEAARQLTARERAGAGIS